jgi:hypothetical protein
MHVSAQITYQSNLHCTLLHLHHKKNRALVLVAQMVRMLTPMRMVVKFKFRFGLELGEVEWRRDGVVETVEWS